MYGRAIDLKDLSTPELQQMVDDIEYKISQTKLLSILLASALFADFISILHLFFIEEYSNAGVLFLTALLLNDYRLTIRSMKRDMEGCLKMLYKYMDEK